jgi:DNA-directed RNA polymerase specialized sigma24 family protein
MDSPELQEFLAELQSGDRQAVEGVLDELGPFLRQVIHMHLLDGRLGHVLETADILQSLLKDFLARREFGLDAADRERGGLRAYLVAAVHNKVRTKMRKERRHAGSLPPEWEPDDPRLSATKDVELRDLIAAVREGLSDGNRRLFDLRVQGLTWADIAERTGDQPNTLRIRLRRAVTAVLHDLGHGDPTHES